MYASKRRQRNFKRVREVSKAEGPTNPSKRHRERLNGELETVAGLLPYDDNTLQRLDKLSVLRLAVSYLQIKAHFQVCASHFPHCSCPLHPYASAGLQMGPVPSILETRSGVAFVDPMEPSFSQVALKALGGFIVALNEQGDILYVSENIEVFLGFLQSDILHQPIFEMVHSEDRDDIRNGLKTEPNGSAENLERVMVARFRSLLDNTCGFIRVELRGRFAELHSPSGAPPNSSNCVFLAVCTPFVPPIQTELPLDDPILKSKHSMDLAVSCIDARLASLLELSESAAANSNYYHFVHPEDVQYVAEAHSAVVKNTSSGLMVYRLVSQRSGRTIYVQSSLRIFFKTNKAESIGGTHRTLTEVDGLALLEKRDSMKSTYLSFDDTLLQSPRQISCIASLQTRPAASMSSGRLKPPEPGLGQLALPMLPLPAKQFADTPGFLPPALLPLPTTALEQRADPQGLVLPGYLSASMPDAELWARGLKRPIEASYEIIPPYYPTPYPTPYPITRHYSGAELPGLAYYQSEINAQSENYDVDYQQPRLCSQSEGFHLEPPSLHMQPELGHSSNNFTFFTEVAHTLLGNT